MSWADRMASSTYKSCQLEGMRDRLKPVSRHSLFDVVLLQLRWVNCLLLREVPFLLSLRLWDTYLAEGPRMKEFLKYVLAAFLLYWSSQLSKMDFQVCPAPHRQL